MSNIRKLRTWVTVQCLACEHSARAGVPVGLPKRYDESGFVLPPRFRCSECGSTATLIQRTGSMEAWARQRRVAR